MKDGLVTYRSWKEIPVTGSRILAVDDNEQNIELLEAYLEAADYVSIKAYSGYECLEILEKESVDLILLDIM
ncbi:MAG: response regulator, partial [Planctomycetota bacterium]